MERLVSTSYVYLELDFPLLFINNGFKTTERTLCDGLCESNVVNIKQQDIVRYPVILAARLFFT